MVKNKTVFCPRCGQKSCRIHQNKTHLVRNLPITNKQVIIKVNRQQFKYKSCQKPVSELLYLVENCKKFTQKYGESIAEQVINNSAKKINKLTAEQVESMVMDGSS
ncbi:transposase family protein [Microcoleus sp. F10-C6]|uniref:transposase family protein n=1 Tax=unclassified Microcoleus TaxID=2642155 RepID=UPI002FD5785F